MRCQHISIRRAARHHMETQHQRNCGAYVLTRRNAQHPCASHPSTKSITSLTTFLTIATPRHPPPHPHRNPRNRTLRLDLPRRRRCLNRPILPRPTHPIPQIPQSHHRRPNRATGVPDQGQSSARGSPAAEIHAAHQCQEAED